MNSIEKINFRQTRDFTELFNVTVKFIRQNFKTFFKSILFIAGPFILLSSLAAGYYQASAIGITTVSRNVFDGIYERYGWSFVVFMMATLLSNLIIIGTIYSYMINYYEKELGTVTVGDVSSKLFQSFGKIVLSFFASLLLMLPVLVVLVGLGFGMYALGYGMFLLYIFLVVIGLLIIFPPLFWWSASSYLSVMHDRGGVFEAIWKCWRVMKGNFWWTWVIIVCALFLLGVIGLVFSVPQIIYQFFVTFSALKGDEQSISPMFIVVTAGCTFLSTLVRSTIHVISGFHYYSLAEQKDGSGLLDRIDEIGHTPKNDVEQQY